MITHHNRLKHFDGSIHSPATTVVMVLHIALMWGTESGSDAYAGEVVKTHRWPLSTDWQLRMDPDNVGLNEGWHTQSPDDQWQPVKVPGHWEDLLGEEYDGIGWYVATFDAPEPEDGMRVGMCLMGVDDTATVFLNGRQLSPALAYLQPKAFNLDGLLKPKENTLHVRVVDHGGEGGLVRDVFLGRYAQDPSELCRSPLSFEHARESVDWVHEAVIYELFLRSFSESGTIDAVTQRLDELQKLGVTLIWLMPVHPVGEKHRKGSLGSPYSVRDYLAVDPAYGDLDDMRNLVAAAHEREIRVVIDWVANHSAWDHAWVDEHPEYYTRDEQGQMQAPVKDWADVADLNYEEPGLRKEMAAALRFWIEEIGIDGFRCDVASMVPRDFWEHVRADLDAIRPIVMLAESDEMELHLKAFDLTYDWGIYALLGDLKGGQLSPRRIKRYFEELESMQPQGTVQMRFSTNHDLCAWEMPAIQRYGPEAAKAAATLVYCLPGVPMIYNGQEVANDKSLSLFEAEKIDWSGDDQGMRALYTDLGALRKTAPGLRSAAMEIFDADAGDQVLRMLRGSGDDAVIVLMNFSGEPQQVTLTGRLAAFEEVLLRSPNVRRAAGKLKLPSMGYWVATVAGAESARPSR
jgi:glycosidase